MKNILRKTWAKLLCFFLCVLFAATSVLSGLAILVLGEEEFYFTEKEAIIKNELYYTACDDANALIFAVSEDKHNLKTDFDSKYTRLRYEVVNDSGSIVGTNIASGERDKYSDWVYTFYFCVNGDGYYGTTYYPVDPNSELPKENVWSVRMSFDETSTASDKYSFLIDLIELGYALRYAVIPICIVSVLLCLLLLVALIYSAGRREGSDEVFVSPLYKFPFDVMLVACVGAVLVLAVLLFDTRHLSDTFAVSLAITLGVTAFCLLVGLLMSASARIKHKSLFKYLLVTRIARLIKRFFVAAYRLVCALPSIWRVSVGVLAFSLLDFLIISLALLEDVFILLWLALHIVFVVIAAYAAITASKLQKAAQRLADGDLSYKCEIKTVFPSLKKHSESLNSISKGMAIAVNERLKSERTKAELITNVSHDIKTPLTSIINYSHLITETACENPDHTEYSAVLLRKSEHLKRLLEDLVEISKASTGNLEIELGELDADVLLSQVSGEFSERCEKASLKLVTAESKTKLTVLADSRRIWRVFENLMGNAVKYSLAGSRVYLGLESDGEYAYFVFKNTSAQELNISPDELAERFVRGDESRTDGGNGLGLSIAKSLTELQGGKFIIEIDGDLFKVTVGLKLS